MSLLKVKTAPFLLIEDEFTVNILPLLLEIVSDENSTLHLFSYEQPVHKWKEVFGNKTSLNISEQFQPESYDIYTSTKCSVVIDSVNQMVLALGWKACLKYLIKLQRDPNVGQLIAILHKDCLTHSSKLQVHLNHIANAIISYNSENHSKISIVIRKSGKFYRSEELLSYDIKTRTLKSIPIIKESKKSEDEPARPSPSNLTTFKIEMDQSEKLEKYKLKLPYMSKINEGEGKVFYEPDAVDDWDEEDPDEDLDI